MSFGPNHYVPILKLKRGEKAAVKALSPKHFGRISPLFEVVELRPEGQKDPGSHVEDSLKDIAQVVKGYPCFFLDTREIAHHGADVVRYAFERAATAGVPFVPVTGISRAADLQPALAVSRNGLAVRIVRDEMESGTLDRQIKDFMSRHKLDHAGVDLILDMGPLQETMVATGVLGLALAFLNSTPNICRWRSLTLAGCAFPKSLGQVERGGNGLVERFEWLAWKAILHDHKDEVKRIPSFGDCVIQHSDGVEGFDPKTMQASAAIRYALADHWLLVKGGGLKTTKGAIQFPRLASELVHGHLRSQFAGASHCGGCRDIDFAVKNPTGRSSPEVWRRFGTIHHLTVVRESMDSLFGPSSSLEQRR